MVKGNAGKQAWMESFKNANSRDIDAFDLATLDGMESDISDQQAIMFQDILLDEAA
tara:strand:+ start:1812 stop:1979 length:168 start_codon:yes stop_codon:yes gene_type:complete